MTSSKISNYYKWLSLVTLIVSIVAPIFWVEGTFRERLGIGLLINLQFHVVYQFMGRAPIGIYQRIEKESPQIKTLAHKIFKFFSLGCIALSIIGFAGFLISVIGDQQYEKLTATMTFFAIFLGGYSSRLKLGESQ